MIKGAFVFAGGLAVGTVYGVVIGIRWTKNLEKVMAQVFEKMVESEDSDEDVPASEATVPGEVTSDEPKHAGTPA